MRIPYSVVNDLADEATDAEIDTITATLRQLDTDSQLGEPIPFNLPDLRDCYIFWTAAEPKWRIVFQRRPAFFFSRKPRVKVLAIEREG